jgi:HD-GYP domain-containing protein (c-di-GMP phosphodiesterase class II)
MSSDPRSDAPSPGPEPADSGEPTPEAADADLIAERGADLLAGLEARLPGRRAHADLTASWALAIAVELGLQKEVALALREAARLHEIGLLYVEAELAARPEVELADEERRAFDAQAEAAARVAAGAGLPARACVWLEHWRERFDGGGPKGLFGGAIPLESRIIRAACAYAVGLTAEPDRRRALERLGARAEVEIDPAAIGAIAFFLDRSE